MEFTASHGQGPYLENADDKLPWLQVFAIRTRDGTYALRNQPVGASGVEKALIAIGEGFTHMGHPDPRKAPGSDRLLPQLARLNKRFRDQDPEPTRVWPATVTILRAMDRVRLPWPRGFQDHCRDLAITAFFYLCRPGEYVQCSGAGTRTTPFRLANVKFASPTKHNIRAASAPLNDVEDSIRSMLEFTDQKNAVRGETIGHSASGDPTLCPVMAPKRIVTRLRLHNAPPETPLYYHYAGGQPQAITSKHIQQLLRAAATLVAETTGIPPDKLTAYSLRSGGATALLCAGRDPIIVQLAGRWKSDSMLRYLRVQAQSLTATHAQDMLRFGAYTFHHSINSADNTDPTNPSLAQRDLFPRQLGLVVNYNCA